MNLYPLFINIINRNKSQHNRIALMADDKDVKKDEKSKKKAFKDFDSSKYIDVEPTLDEKEDTNEALLTRMQRRARGITMRKNRFKIKRGREKAARRMASVEILKKRARKQAIRNLKAKFSKNKRYAEMSAGEKIVIDKRISKLPASRLNAMARKLLPSVKTAERARKTHAKKESVSLTNIVDNNLNEATMWGQRQGKRPHMLLDKDNKPKFDKRFRMYKPKMEESFDDFDDILNLLETTEDYVNSNQGQEDMQSFKENTRLRLINKIKNSGVVKTGSMSKDVPVKKEKEEIKELTIADVQKATAMAKKRQEKERKAGKKGVSTTDLAARMPKKEAADLADLANEKIKDKKDIGEIPKDGEIKFKRRKTIVDKEIEKDNMEEGAPKIKGDYVKMQRAMDAEHDDAMGRTASGRKKPVRAMTSTQRSLASIAAKNEAFGRARFSQELKRKGMDVNKMHSDNIKDAEAAKKRSAEAEKDLADFRKKHGMKESTEQLDELSPETMMSYKKKADYSADRAANSAAAKILRGKDKDGNRADHSPELKTMKKRREGDRLYNTRAADKLRKALRKEATIPDGQTAFTKTPDVTDSDKDKLLKIKAMMDKERAKKNTNEKYASDAQRKAVWASRNDKKNEAQVDEMDISVKSITKSGLRKAGDTPKLKADLKALRDRLNKDKGDGYGASKSLKANYGEECGAGEQGTPSLTKRLKKDTPNA